MEEKGFEIHEINENETKSDSVNFDSFSIDDLNLSEPEVPHSPKKKKKSTGTLTSLIWVLAIVIISLAIAAGIIYAGADYLGVGFGRGKTCVIEIPEGSPTVVIADKLEESGSVKLPLLFRIYSKLKHFDGQYKYGVYHFNTELGYDGIANMLMTEGAVAETKTVTIPEMSMIDDIAKILEENGICETGDFIDAVQNGDFNYDFIKKIPTESVYYRLEGYLFPDTYEFYACEDSAEGAYLAVELMLSNFDKKVNKLIKEKSESKYSYHEYVTMASMIELEASGSPDEMANVAAVFYNRLESDDFSTLGSSSTIEYPHGDGRYDTYTCIGLPPGPLCSPSINSFKAALNPNPEMKCFYFVTDSDEKFYYRNTLDEHNAIINKLKAEKKWIYDD